MALKIYNSLTREIETFSSTNKSIGMYTCGPTVYSYVTVGNWRTYVLSDIVHRSFRYLGHHVDFYMNITDVGHLTGDNSGDADNGDDRMEKAKNIEGKNAWEIAQFYTNDFKLGYKLLNLLPANKLLIATEHIPLQIALVQNLFDKGLAYTVNDGIYFDTEAYEKLGFTYGELSNIDQVKAGARVEFNHEKRNIRDFALWKFSPKDKKRDMEWESPWGVGFPGWHIECSAMSMSVLGSQFDIHIGGEDLKSTHHPNEIAQSQGATGVSPFVKTWIHGAFLQVDGGRMGKSLGNAYILKDLEKKGYSPLSLRYFYLQGHYRSPLNFTWDAIESANTALNRVKDSIWEGIESIEEAEKTGVVDEKYRSMFIDAIENDFNMPKALSVLHELVHDKNIYPSSKLLTALNFDEVLGLDLGSKNTFEVPDEIIVIANQRELARANKDWAKSDELRQAIEEKGFLIKDTNDGYKVTKK